MGFMDNLKGKIKNLLKIVNAQDVKTSVQEGISFNNQAVINKVMYNGSAYEIEQVFKYFRPLDYTSFWGNVPSSKDMRKVHVGIPQILVNTLANLVLSDFKGIEVKKEYKDIWEQIENENSFDELLEKALKDVLVTSDGAFKISYCADISDLPILEFYSAELIELTVKKGRTIEVIFKEEIKRDDEVYYLNEVYGKGYIRYKLYDDLGNEIPTNILEETKNLKDIAFFKDGKIDTSIFLAIPFKIFPNPREKNRGKSIFTGKIQLFDAIDEIMSSWLQDIRISKNTQYISESLLSRDKNGQIMDINGFDRKFLKLKTTVGAGLNSDKIDVLSPEVKHSGYQLSYKELIESCCLGIISPSSVGIDNDNASVQNAKAQKQKEKTSYYNRNNIINSLNTVIPDLVNMCLKSYELQTGKNSVIDVDYEAKINFAQFDNPGWDAVWVTMGDAYAKGAVSSEMLVKTVWADKLTDEEQEKEIQLLNENKNGGFMDTEEPSVGNNNFDDNAFNTDEPADKTADDSAKDDKTKDNPFNKDDSKQSQVNDKAPKNK